MTDKHFLQRLADFDEKEEPLDYKELVENLELLEKANARLHNILITARMKKLMQDFGEKETDIYVTTFPKSGTTLMQMIVYQLTTDGNMDFVHLYDVSPWCRFSAYFNRRMPDVGEPRIIKTHDEYEMLASVRKGKFIFVIRDCLDVIASLHQHIRDYNDPGADFERLSSRKMKEWFAYNTEWIRNRSGLEILYVHYEDLIADKKSVVLKIAQFLELEVTEPLLARVLERTSFEFMKQHESKFGEQPDHWKVYNNFIRSGKAGEGQHRFTAVQLEHYRNLFQEFQVESDYLKRYTR